MSSPKISDLFISKVRVKLIQSFLTNPNEIFYVRQLVRMTGEEINAVRRELAHMESAEMVKKETRGNRLYYWFRKEYLFYAELVRMVIKTTGLGDDILKNRNKLGKLNFVFFSGRFCFHLPKDSHDDIDVLLVGDVVLPEITALVQAEEARRKIELNYSVMSDHEFQMRKNGRDPFLLSILSKTKVMIIGDEERLIK